jgi:hypothetical protein
MRKLDADGIDTVLPDLPGCNESLAPLDQQTLKGWRAAAVVAAKVFNVSHVLTIRAGALLAPNHLPGWRYAPQTGPKLLRSMVRARVIASREDGRDESSEQLQKIGRHGGLMLAGWHIGPEMFRELDAAECPPAANKQEISQSALGGAGLWLRAEPGHNSEQVEKLAALLSDTPQSAR